MHLNIAQKIFGIAIVILALMATVAALSVRLTAKISAELDFIATKQLPLSDTIGRINVRILERGVLLQQLLAAPDQAAQAISRINSLGTEINRDFEKTNELFKAEERSKFAPQTIQSLHRSLDTVEREYREFEKHSRQLLTLRDAGDNGAFTKLLPQLNRQQNVIDDELDTLRRHVEAVVEDTVKRVDEDEKFLLWFNAGLTALSAILGLGFATFVTIVLVRNVRNLVRAAEQVEDGQLDVELPVVTRDEVGRLTASFNEMVEGLRTKERIKDTFGKYMDPRIVANLLDNPEMTQLGGERREMTVMFIDLQGYTSISEKLSPDELVGMLNMFLGQMTDAISAHSGVINDFLGDAVMSYWGPPFTPAEEQATLACKAAIQAFENFEKFRTGVAAELGNRSGELDLGMRIGISTGDVVAGNIGSASTRKYSLVGDPVNLGARLEGANKNYGSGILLSDRTRELAGANIFARELDYVQVKGKTEPTRIHQLFATEQAPGSFAAGLEAYRAQDWDAAEQAFTACTTEAPDDPVPLAFLERIRHFRSQPPGAGWDGVWEFETK